MYNLTPLQPGLSSCIASLPGAELAKMSRQSGWGRWSIISSLASYLINNLQLSINGVHIRFMSPETARMPKGAVLGVQCGKLFTTAGEGPSFSASLLRMVGRGQQAPRIQREVCIQGWQLYLDPDPDSRSHYPAEGADTSRPTHAGQSAQSRQTVTAESPRSKGNIICPVDTVIRVAVQEGAAGGTAAEPGHQGHGADGHQVQLELLTLVEAVVVQVGRWHVVCP